MRKMNNRFRATLLSRVAVVGAVGAFVAGCSADVTRFAGGSFFGGTSEPEYTGSIPPAPTGAVSSAPLADPRGQPAYSQLGGAPAGSGGDGTSVLVGPGETVFTIATRYGVPSTALMKVNGISDPSAVQAGQRLVIPVFSQANNGWVRPDQASTAVKVAGPAPVGTAFTSPAAKPVTTTSVSAGGIHTVEPGQTVYSLGRLYGVRPTDIITLNNLQAPYGIRVGQKVRIPGAVASATPASSANGSASGSPASDSTPVPKPQPVALTSTQPASKTGVESSAIEPPKQQVASLPKEGDDDVSQQSGAAVPSAAAAGTFRWPVRGRIISSFGEKGDGGTNDGINVSVPEGTSVRASENGVVAYAGNELKGYGNLILVRHEGDWVTAYAHNSELLVKRGDVVSRGQVIAKAGQTGTVTTPQMHFELRKGSQPVDPLKYLEAD
jgi:murein DD-endopeptidase MepM/ murein hydrolase activator NlpD